MRFFKIMIIQNRSKKVVDIKMWKFVSTPFTLNEKEIRVEVNFRLKLHLKLRGQQNFSRAQENIILQFWP